MQSRAQIDQALRQKVDAKEIPGVVAMAATGNEIIYQGAFGKRDLSKDDPMTLDSVFWIASMTKAITAAAAMQFVEQGKLSLDAPIGKLLSRATPARAGNTAPTSISWAKRWKPYPASGSTLTCASICLPARYERYRLQAHRFAAPTPGRDACARRGFERGVYAGLDAGSGQKAA